MSQIRKGRRSTPDLRAYRKGIVAKLRASTIVTDAGCWEWTGFRNRLGYGTVNYGGRTWMLHRLAYCATKGAFDKNLDICHRCDNRACWRPGHLWVGTMLENMLDSLRKGRHAEAARTHCKNGHPLSGPNRYSPPCEPTKRQCRACQVIYARLRAGWPKELAFSLPKQRLGFRPPEVRQVCG